MVIIVCIHELMGLSHQPLFQRIIPCSILLENNCSSSKTTLCQNDPSSNLGFVGSLLYEGFLQNWDDSQSFNPTRKKRRKVVKIRGEAYHWWLAKKWAWKRFWT